MEVLLVLVGAAAGLAGSIVTETFRSRREQARWLVDRRHDVYVRGLAHVDRLLTWARNEVSAPGNVDRPHSDMSFHEFAANLALVGSKSVQDAWVQLDTSFRQFPLMHDAAMSALRDARSAGHTDSDDAIRLRLVLDTIVTASRGHQVTLAKAMERDLNAPRRAGGHRRVRPPTV